jgi:hypothetical protein
MMSAVDCSPEVFTAHERLFLPVRTCHRKTLNTPWFIATPAARNTPPAPNAARVAVATKDPKAMANEASRFAAEWIAFGPKAFRNGS